MDSDFKFNEMFEKMMDGLDTVIILAHMNPDGDAAGSVLSLSHYLKVNYPEYTVIPYLSDKLDKGPKKMVKEDPVFDPFVKPEIPDKPYAVIVCDTAKTDRIIGKEYFDRACVTMIIDHHAANNGYGDINYTLISESCSENIFYILDNDCLKKAMSEETYPNAADYIYLGIIQDTDAFKRAKVPTMNATSELLKLGVDHAKVMKTMQNETLDDLIKRSEILQKAVIIMEGKAAYIVIDREEKDKCHISFEDIHPISGIIRDCEGIKLGFTMYEEEPGIWRCSFRSDGEWINVNELLLPFGGGGHAGAAGLRKETDNVEELKNQLLSRIAELTVSGN